MIVYVKLSLFEDCYSTNMHALPIFILAWLTAYCALQHWAAGMIEALLPFIADFAHQFVRELLAFLAAGLSIKQYDSLIYGDDAEHPKAAASVQQGTHPA